MDEDILRAVKIRAKNNTGTWTILAFGEKTFYTVGQHGIDPKINPISM